MSPPSSPQLMFIVALPTTPTFIRVLPCHPRIYQLQGSRATKAATSLPTPPAMELCYEWVGREGSPGSYSVSRLSGFRGFVLSLVSYYYNVFAWLWRITVDTGEWSSGVNKAEGSVILVWAG